MSEEKQARVTERINNALETVRRIRGDDKFTLHSHTTNEISDVLMLPRAEVNERNLIDWIDNGLHFDASSVSLIYNIVAPLLVDRGWREVYLTVGGPHELSRSLTIQGHSKHSLDSVVVTVTPVNTGKAENLDVEVGYNVFTPGSCDDSWEDPCAYCNGDDEEYDECVNFEASWPYQYAGGGILDVTTKDPLPPVGLRLLVEELLTINIDEEDANGSN